MVETGLKFIIIYYYSEIYRFIMILKFVKTILKFQDKKRKRKKDENDMVADMAQCEYNNIKRYASVFSNIQMSCKEWSIKFPISSKKVSIHSASSRFKAGSACQANGSYKTRTSSS